MHWNAAHTHSRNPETTRTHLSNMQNYSKTVLSSKVCYFWKMQLISVYFLQCVSY